MLEDDDDDDDDDDREIWMENGRDSEAYFVEVFSLANVSGGLFRRRSALNHETNNSYFLLDVKI